MADYISREDYCEAECGKENREGYKTCKNCSLLNVPSSKVQSMRHGKWVLKENAIFTDECSLCERSVSTLEAKFYKYCPYCGARMDGEQDG